MSFYHGHIGIYVGNGKVIEACTAWGGKVNVTDIDIEGKRTKDGSGTKYWYQHGKLPYLNYEEQAKPEPEPQTISIDDIAKEVIEGKWGNGQERKDRLTQAGYDYSAIQNRVNEMLAPQTQKSIDDLAREVIRGDWGNGQERKDRLTQAGYDYSAIQKKVNEILK